MSLKIFRIPPALLTFLFGVTAVLAFDSCLSPETSSVARPPQEPLTFEVAVADLAEGKDNATVEKALKTLSGAGTAAFPTLIAHLGDQRKASFQHFGGKAILVKCPPAAEPCPPYHPTIGEACFDILAGQVEGNWPKGYRSYYTLTPENVAAWWQARRGMSLKELQLEAARSSLAAARNDYARRKRNNDGAEFLKGVVKFLEANLKDVEEGRCCR